MIVVNYNEMVESKFTNTINIDLNKSDVILKINYVSDLKDNETIIQSSDVEITNNKQHKNTFHCVRQRKIHDNNKDIIIVNCNNSCKNIINLINSKSIEIIINDDISSSVKQSNNYNNNSFNSALSIIKESSDIEVNNSGNTSKISIIDTAGKNIFINTHSNNKKSKNISLEHNLISDKNVQMYVGDFVEKNEKDQNNINLYIHNPKNMILYTNNDNLNLHVDKNKEKNFSFIQTLESQIIGNNYNKNIKLLINDVKKIMNNIFEDLISNNKTKVLKNLSEFIVVFILYSMHDQIDIIGSKNLQNKNIQHIESVLNNNKLHKTITSILNYLDRKEFKHLFNSNLIENTRNYALSYIREKKHNQIYDGNSIQSKTKHSINQYINNQNWIINPIQNMLLNLIK